MNDDPIVAEVRLISEERGRRFDYDIHRIFADMMTRSVPTDPAHPVAENVDQWVETAGARETLAVSEEPPPK